MIRLLHTLTGLIIFFISLQPLYQHRQFGHFCLFHDPRSLLYIPGVRMSDLHTIPNTRSNTHTTWQVPLPATQCPIYS
ncbi:uncharacterized protein BO88DRAFT_100379 [Aspergillus vadensis CBS 113365]|uniref:Secreted protein n=1 Tax=Aspergillus vadensis (strain CBS 113365 / IMI 142717 / IBT 24658) TaxID=1448311 RepID=A0A319BMK3_ASPVC|nr:hypothetical protein BO88DRAFT_100379 [Aspergillus vadensis CBS 113365]PYH73574.1 hypothetical protein BO88DRAFT_100379 [Aspergillus vadensis CBS 113365]